MMQLIYRWWLLVLRGLVILLSGLAALISPVATLTALRLLFGAYALVDGFIVMSRLARTDLNYGRMLRAKGLASIALGVLIGLWSSVTAPALVAIIAVWVILTRAFETGTMRMAAEKWQTIWGNLAERKMVRAR